MFERVYEPLNQTCRYIEFHYLSRVLHARVRSRIRPECARVWKVFRERVSAVWYGYTVIIGGAVMERARRGDLIASAKLCAPSNAGTECGRGWSEDRADIVRVVVMGRGFDGLEVFGGMELVGFD